MIRIDSDKHLRLKELSDKTGLKLVDLGRAAVDGLLDYAEASGGKITLPIDFNQPTQTLESIANALGLHKIQPLQAVAEDPQPYGNITELPFAGAAAAGEPVEAPRNETISVPGNWPAGHYVLEVNGQSAEPEFPDGSRWVIDGRNCYTPKQGVPCIVADENGSYLKKWNSKQKIFESINPEFPDIAPGDSATLRGYPVKRLS